MSDDVTLGELVRRVDRLESTVNAGFIQLGEKMDRLPFVQVVAYEADKTAATARMLRIEADLRDEAKARQAADEQEEQAREAAELRGDQRSWQVRTAIGVAVLGTVLSILVPVVTSQSGG